MKKHRIFWGLVLILAAVFIVVNAILKDTRIFGNLNISLWNVACIIALAYWAGRCLIKGVRFSDKFECLIPIGIGFLIFEDEIADLLGIEGDLISDWIVIAVVALLVVAIHLLFDGNENKVTASGVSSSTSKGSSQSNTMTSSTVYFDLSESDNFNCSNKLGETNIYFQNEDRTDISKPVILNIDNMLGSTTVTVPADRKIECNMINKLGEINVDQTNEFKAGKIIINGSNKLGSVNIRY